MATDHSNKPIRLGLLGLALGALGLTLALPTEAEAEESATNPIIVFGMDGGEWSVIESLWEQGELPNLKKLSDRGVRAPLNSHYGLSPIIWTSIATGMEKDTHGISGFTIHTDKGDVPFSSTLRKVPAIWNMASTVDKQVAVLGWWATWPAEDINGVMLTERGQGKDAGRISPDSYMAEFKAELKKVNSAQEHFQKGDNFSPEDRMVHHFGRSYARSGDYDLILAYFRGTDAVSHKYWKYWEPEAFESVDPGVLEAKKDIVPDKYVQTDKAIGDIIAAAPPNTNFFVVSDHGFHAEPGGKDRVKITMDTNKVFQELGLLTYAANGTAIDYANTTVFTHRSQIHSRRKKLRLSVQGREQGGVIPPDQVDAKLAELKSQLKKVRYDSGAPVFAFQSARDKDDCDIILQVLADGDTVSKVLVYEGREITGTVKHLSVITGSHQDAPAGLFIAAGPDIDPKADATGVDIHDVTPTVLYGMGMPVGKDMHGEAQVHLFTGDFRAKHPLQTIDSWGTREGNTVSTGQDDEAHMEQLRALGYID